MTIVSPPAKVLVTGASGFIATWIVHALLERGFAVRGTVRSTSKGDFLKNLYKEHGEKLEYTIVDDIQKDGAFDDAVKGVDAVIHTASVVTLSAKRPDDVIVPAVRGTTGVLESVLKHGSSVKRVIVTSSVSSLFGPRPAGHVFDENDWNDGSVEHIKQFGDNSNPAHYYAASKVLAERSAWDFVEKHKNEINFDLVTILPGFVWGPLTNVTSQSRVNDSSMLIIGAVLKEKTPEELRSTGGDFIDVRDVASYHAAALEKPEAAGERYIISSDSFAWQDIYDALHSITPPIEGVPVGEPGVGKEAVHVRAVSALKAQKAFGIKFRGLAETARDSLLSYRALAP